LQELGITALHIKLHATGGNKIKSPGPGAQSAVRALARCNLKIGRLNQHYSYVFVFICDYLLHVRNKKILSNLGRIEDTTSIPSDSTRRKVGNL